VAAPTTVQLPALSLCCPSLLSHAFSTSNPAYLLISALATIICSGVGCPGCLLMGGCGPLGGRDMLGSIGPGLPPGKLAPASRGFCCMAMNMARASPCSASLSILLLNLRTSRASTQQHRGSALAESTRQQPSKAGLQGVCRRELCNGQ
jgi:hypothetical protein